MALFSFTLNEICGLVWGVDGQPLSSEFQSLFERSQTNSQLFVVGCCKKTVALWGVKCSDVCVDLLIGKTWEYFICSAAFGGYSVVESIFFLN